VCLYLLILTCLQCTIVSHSSWGACCTCAARIAGLSLTIPLAMLSDLIFHGASFSPAYFVGSACVVVGFVLVNRKYVDTHPAVAAGAATVLPHTLNTTDEDVASPYAAASTTPSGSSTPYSTHTHAPVASDGAGVSYTGLVEASGAAE